MSAGCNGISGLFSPFKKAEFQLRRRPTGSSIAALEAQSKALGKLGSAMAETRSTCCTTSLPRQMNMPSCWIDRRPPRRLWRASRRCMGNATSVSSRTTAGAISNLSNRFELLGKTVGKDLLPVVTAVVRFCAGILAVIFAVAVAVTALTMAWGINVAVTTAIIGKWSIARIVGATLGGVMDFMTGSVTALAISFQMLGVSAMSLGIMYSWRNALVAGLVLVVTHFNTVRSVIAGVFNWLKGAVNTVVNFVGQHWKEFAVGGADFLGGPFLALGVFVATHFALVKRLAGDVVGFLGRIFGSLGHALAWPFEQLWKIITKVFNFITGKGGTLSKIFSWMNPVGLLGHGLSIGKSLLSDIGLHNGGIVHAATGGIFGGVRWRGPHPSAARGR